MPTLADLPTPALLVDLDRLEANLRRMQERCARLGVALRPHVKTHKCLEVGRMQRELGARGITVATLEEARDFADGGFDDLTWAFPLVPGRLPEAIELARRVTLRLTLDTPEALAEVRKAAEAASRAAEEPLRLHVHLEVDCGDHRSGVDPASERAVELARGIAASEHLVFDGLLTHSGHAYQARSREEAAAVAEEERSVMARLAERLRAEGIEVPAVSVGSTPAMAAAEDLAGVTEARPGNYAYYDLMQVTIGSCRPEDCALTVLATVVSSQPGAEHSVIDAGALSLSKDPGTEDMDPPGFGEVREQVDDFDEGPPPPRVGAELVSARAPGTGSPREEASSSPTRVGGNAVRVASLSQEHGVLSAPLPTGTRVRITPNHSCLTNACFDRVHAVRGREVVDTWRIVGRR
ncbi:MAG: alanine racemase [Acidobacteriota bacterium]